MDKQNHMNFEEMNQEEQGNDEAQTGGDQPAGDASDQPAGDGEGESA
jgi:hypothetical protein